MPDFAFGKFLLPLVIIAVVTFGLPEQRVLAAVIQVDDTCSLHDAIVSANRDEARGGCPAGDGADTILLTGDVTLTEELPVIESIIAIEGHEYQISGNAKFRIFDVTGGGLTIKNMTLSQGYREGRRGAAGGAIRLRNGARASIENSAFVGNTAGAGGAIYTANWNVRLDIQRSSFSGNESDFGGGAIQIDGGTVNISSSSFSDNTTGDNGGAIEALRGRVRVWNSTFSHNRARLGGGIYVRAAEVTLTHVTLAGNRSRFGGDSLFRTSGLLRLRNSIVSGDSAEDDCVGRLDQHQGNLIADWSCRSPLGGNPQLGDYESALGYSPLRDGSPALDAANPAFCLDTDQIGTARPQGGGCDIGAYESTTAMPASRSPLSICTLSYQIIAANQQRWIGACPPGDGADTIILTEDITLTEALPRITSDISIEGNGRTISGDNRYRIFDVEEGSLSIKDLTLTNGNAKDSLGGAIFLGYKAVADATNVAFKNNSAKNGGAIYVGILANLRVAHSLFQGNAATYRGGALNVRGQADISRSVMSGNTAESDGGAIFTDEILHITNSTLERNAADEGGAIYVDSSEVYLTHVTMIGNQGRNGGDAIHRGRRGRGEITLRNSIVAGGSANADCSAYLDKNVSNLIEDGSCLPEYEGDPILDELPGASGVFVPIDGSPVINAADPRYCLDTDQNGTQRPFGAACDIGAIEATSDVAAAAAPALLECSLHDRILAANTDGAVGGCPAGTDHDIIHISEDIKLREVLPAITGAITIEGGGHIISGNNQFRIFEVHGGELTINNLILANGHAASDGGALHLHNGAHVTVNDSVFWDNSSQWGGAINMEGRASTLSVSGTLFVGNRSVNTGGAVLLSSGTANFNSSSFLFNSSKEYSGGALSTLFSVPTTITNSTFIANRAPSGGALSFSSGSETTLKHLTMLNNRATERDEGHAINIRQNASQVRLYNSIIAGDPASGEQCHGQLQENSGNMIEDGSCAPALRGDPQLADLTGSPPYLPLRDTSPAIDSADPAHCPATDQVGNARPQGGGCDIGAIEYAGG